MINNAVLSKHTKVNKKVSFKQNIATRQQPAAYRQAPPSQYVNYKQPKINDYKTLGEGLLVAGGTITIGVLSFLVGKTTHKKPNIKVIAEKTLKEVHPAPKAVPKTPKVRPEAPKTPPSHPKAIPKAPKTTPKMPKAVPNATVGIENIINNLPKSTNDGQLKNLDQLDRIKDASLIERAKASDTSKEGEILFQDPMYHKSLNDNLDQFALTFNHFAHQYDNMTKNEVAQGRLAMLVYDHIYKSMPYAPQYLLTGNENILKDEVIHLGEFIRLKSGVCRHRAALGDVMGDEIKSNFNNIEVVTRSNGGHSWNYLIFNRKEAIAEQQIFKIDTIFGTITKYKKGYTPPELAQQPIV